MDHGSRESADDNGEHIPSPSPKTGSHDKDWKCELGALAGFCLSGVFFIISSIRNGDILTLVGCIIWVASCLCWMIPYRKYLVRRPDDHP